MLFTEMTWLTYMIVLKKVNIFLIEKSSCLFWNYKVMVKLFNIFYDVLKYCLKYWRVIIFRREMRKVEMIFCITLKRIISGLILRFYIEESFDSSYFKFHWTVNKQLCIFYRSQFVLGSNSFELSCKYYKFYLWLISQVLVWVT